jgi:hypothetical protein
VSSGVRTLRSERYSCLLRVGVTSCSNSSGGVVQSAVFTKTIIYVDQLETPVKPPLTVGSVANPSTLHSDAPDIVEVVQDGKLIAHRNGTAHIRTSGGTVLTVEARTVRALSVNFNLIRLDISLRGRSWGRPRLTLLRC